MSATATPVTYAGVSTQRVTADNGIEYAYRDLGAGDVPLVLLQHFRGNLDNWKRAFRPGKRSFANANPASALKKTTATVTVEATIAELISAFQKSTLTSPESNSLVRLCQSSVPGVRTGG